MPCCGQVLVAVQIRQEPSDEIDKLPEMTSALLCLLGLLLADYMGLPKLCVLHHRHCPGTGLRTAPFRVGKYMAIHTLLAQCRFLSSCPIGTTRNLIGNNTGMRK